MDQQDTFDGKVAAATYPMDLSIREVLECMEEMGAPMSKEELTEPIRHRDRLRQMWYKVLECLTGQMEDDINFSLISEDSTEEDKMMHSDVGDMPLFRALHRLMKIAHYPDYFSMRDIYAPEPKRLKKQLMAVINMAKYREEQVLIYTQMIEERMDLIENLVEVQKEHEELQKQHLESRASSNVKEAELEQIQEECKELELEIVRDSTLQGKARDEASRLKKQEHDLKDEITVAEWNLEELEIKKENLRAQIVSSPDRRRAEMEELRHRLHSEKKENMNIDSNIERTKEAVRNLQRAEKDLKTTTVKLGDLHQSANKYMKLLQVYDETRGEIDELKKKLHDIEESSEQAQRHARRAEEEVLAQRKQHSIQLEATQESLDSFKSQLLLVEKERREGMMRVQQGEAEVLTLQKAMEAARLKTEQEIQEMTNEYKQVEEAVFERDRLRREALGITLE